MNILLSVLGASHIHVEYYSYNFDNFTTVATFVATCSPRFPLDQRAQGGLFILYNMAKTIFNAQALTSNNKVRSAS